MDKDNERVKRFPVLVPGMTCQRGEKPHPVRGKYVYSFDGTPWRCWDCLRKQLRKINELRQRNEAEDNSPARIGPEM